MNTPNIENRIEEISGLEQFLEKTFEKMIAEGVSNNAIMEGIDDIFDSEFIPEDFREKVVDHVTFSVFKKQIFNLVKEITTKASLDHLTNEEVTDIFVKRFLLLLVSNHTSGIAISVPSEVFKGVELLARPESKESDNNMTPTPPRLRTPREMLVGSSATTETILQQAMGVLLLGVSGYTSFRGGENLFASEISPKLFTPEMKDALSAFVTITPEVQVYMNYTFGIMTATLISFWALRTFKKDIVQNAIDHDQTLWKSFRGFSAGRGNVGIDKLKAEKIRISNVINVMSIMMALFLFYDAYSNVNGIISDTVGRSDKAVQMNQTLRPIRQANAILRDKAESLPAEIEKAERSQIDKDIQDELEGKSASGKGGAGPMYYAKVLGLQDSTDQAALDYFKKSKSKTAEFTWTLINKDPLLNDDFKGYPEEIRKTYQKHANEVIQQSKEVDSIKFSYDDEIEIVNKKLSQIEVIMDSMKSTLQMAKGSESKKDYEKVMNKYDQYGQKLLRIPARFPSVYKDYEPTKIKKLGQIQINLPDVKYQMPDIQYKTAQDLILEKVEQNKHTQALVMLLLALIVAIASSHADMIFFKGLRDKTRQDKLKTDNLRETTYGPMKDGLVSLLNNLINSTYSEALWGDASFKIPEPIVRQAVDEYLAKQREMYDTNMTRLRVAKSTLSKYLPTFVPDEQHLENQFRFSGETSLDKKRKEIGETFHVTEYNRDMLILVNLISDPRQIEVLVASILDVYTHDSINSSAKATTRQARGEVMTKIADYAASIQVPAINPSKTIYQLQEDLAHLEKDLNLLINYQYLIEARKKEVNVDATIEKIKATMTTIEELIEEKKISLENTEANKIAAISHAKHLMKLHKLEQNISYFEHTETRLGKLISHFRQEQFQKDSVESLRDLNIFYDVIGARRLDINDLPYIHDEIEYLNDHYDDLVSDFSTWETLGLLTEERSIHLQDKLDELRRDSIILIRSIITKQSNDEEE